MFKFKKSPVGQFRELLVNSIEVKQPRAWEQLSDEDAWKLLKLIVNVQESQEWVQSMAFMTLNDVAVLGKNGKGNYLCSLGGRLFEMGAGLLARLSAPLSFMFDAPRTPWRPERFRDLIPAAADLSDTTFGDWLIIESNYQGVVATGNFELFDNLHAILMRRQRHLLKRARQRTFTPAERLAVFLWLRAVKNHLADRYRDFFAPAGGESGVPDANALRDSIDTQIRALTKGDITKEDEIMGMNMYRALAELNAQAREYNSLKSKT